MDEHYSSNAVSGDEDDVEVLSETPKPKRTKLTVSVYTVVCCIMFML